jgi:hypothetical protein
MSSLLVLSRNVTPNINLRNFILFLSIPLSWLLRTYGSPPYIRAALWNKLYIVNYISDLISLWKCLIITPFSLLFFWVFSSRFVFSLYTDILCPRYLKKLTWSIIFPTCNNFGSSYGSPLLCHSFGFIIWFFKYAWNILFTFDTFCYKLTSLVVKNTCSSANNIELINLLFPRYTLWLLDFPFP